MLWKGLVIFLGVALFLCCFAKPRHKRIIDGDQFYEISRMPWIVYIHSTFYDSRMQSVCGGSMITENVVLTAAHCVFNKTLASSVMVYSKGPLKIGARAEDIFEAIEVIVHPMFVRNKMTLAHDIAMIILDRPLHLRCGAIVGRPQQFASMPDASVTASGRRLNSLRCFTVGWGLTEDLVPSMELLKADLPQPFYATSHYGERILLAHLNSTSRPCMGDSGSPLICADADSSPFVVGVNSAVTHYDDLRPRRFRREITNITDCINANAIIVTDIQDNLMFIKSNLYTRGLRTNFYQFGTC